MFEHSRLLEMVGTNIGIKIVDDYRINILQALHVHMHTHKDTLTHTHIHTNTRIHTERRREETHLLQRWQIGSLRGEGQSQQDMVVIALLGDQSTTNGAEQVSLGTNKCNEVGVSGRVNLRIH